MSQTRADVSDGRPVTVLVVDDHALFREGLAALVDQWAEFEIAAQACDGEEGVRLAASLRPDLVLMDVRMPGIGGVEATRRITEQDAAVRVVMLTMSHLGEDVFLALRSGAHGYLSKNEPPERLRDYLTDVMRGETALSSTIAAKVLAEFGAVGAGIPSRSADHLSPRERDVLRLLVDGLSNDEIATTLCLSEATVKKHLGRVMTKLHMRNRVQVAVYSVRTGLVD